MRYEVVEDGSEWIVRRAGQELARFADQDRALSHVAEQLRGADTSNSASLSVRYQARSA